SLLYGCVLLLEFKEQAGILDGNGGAVSKRLQQFDLSIGETSNLAAAHYDAADKAPCLNRRNGEERTIAFGEKLILEGVGRIRHHIRDLFGRALHGRSPYDAVTQRRWPFLQRFDEDGRQ